MSMKQNESKPKNTARNVTIIIAVLAAVIVAASVAVLLHGRGGGTPTGSASQSQAASGANSSDETVEGELSYNGAWYVPKENVETILFMGLDKFEDQIRQQNGYMNDQQADFNLLLVIDRKTGDCQALQLNRDTMCQITELGVAGDAVQRTTAQLALAHTYGSGSSDSCINQKKAVSELLYGMTIDHYVALSMDAVPVINDAVGGVAVRCMDDLTAYDPSLTEGAEITLMGDQALYYVRARMNAGDQTNIRRMERQRQYMLELWKDVSAAGAQDPDFLAKLVLNLGDKLQTDCSSTQMQTLFDSVSALDVNEIKTIDGESVKGEKFMEFYADDASLQQTVIDLFYDRVSEN